LTSPKLPRLAVIALALFGLVLVVVFLATISRSCSGCSPIDVPPEGIDAGPGLEIIDAQEREAELETQRRLDAIERAHEEDLAAFDEQQRRKYEHVREQGPDAVAAWLTEFNRRMRDAGR
jgi:hypothetical protein